MPEITVVDDGIVVTVDKAMRIFEHGSIVIENDRIVDVNEASLIKEKYKADKVIDARKKLVLPGLVNAHTHSAMLERGLFDDMPLLEYLNRTKPSHKALTPEDAYVGSLLSYCESIKSGTTSVLDMPRFTFKCAEAVEKVGIRATIASYAANKVDYYETYKDNERLLIEKNGAANGRIRVMFGATGLLHCDQEYFLKIRELANKYKVGIHTHLNEQIPEIEQLKQVYGKRPVEYAYDLGLLGSDSVVAHCVWLTNHEIKTLKTTETNVVHCPKSNMKIGSGIAPVTELINAGVNVGLGADGFRANNNLDLIEEMKFASLLQKVSKLDPTVMPAVQVLKMATINGAKALGLEDQIGSIEHGKKADMILISLDNLRLTPAFAGENFNLISHLVYAAHGDDVDTTIINGKIVMKNRKLQNVNESDLIEMATRTAQDLIEREKQYM